MRPFVVGITGGSGSGKTYFQKKLTAELGAENLCIVSHDNYYRTIDQQPKDSNGVENFDRPESIDLHSYAEDIKKLKAGEVIQRMEYTFNNPALTPRLLTFEPRPIIILEGIFVFHNKEVSDLIDLKLFVDAKPHVQIKRRIMRDTMERDSDLTDVLYRYEHHIMPSYEKYIAIHKNTVDLVICNDHGFDQALNVVTTFLKSKIEERINE
ncbi:uridine kinase [Algivirga pacifica]|uniref:Uridine kinase n=1 Tax=Algivirga pacifica TaxID=1162670 RepID=A0ABP9DHK5_9BACT